MASAPTIDDNGVVDPLPAFGDLADAELSVTSTPIQPEPTLQDAYAAKREQQFDQSTSPAWENPMLMDDDPAPIRDEEKRLNAMLADRENLGGVADDVLAAAQDSYDVQDFKDGVVNWRATAFLLNTPVDQLKDEDYQKYQTMVSAKLGKNVPKTEAEYRQMLADHFNGRATTERAYNELHAQAVVDALEATNYGTDFPMVQDQGRRIANWMAKYPEVSSPGREWLIAKSAGDMYAQTLADLADVRQYAAPAYRTLLDYTQGKAGDEEMGQLANKLRDLTPAQMEKINGYVALAAETQQIDRGDVSQFGKNLAQSLNRGFDWLGTMAGGDINKEVTAENNRAKLDAGADLYVVDDKDAGGGKVGFPYNVNPSGVANQLPKYLQMAVVGDDPKAIQSQADLIAAQGLGEATPRDAAPLNSRKATQEERDAYRKSMDEAVNAFRMARQLRNLASTGVDPIRPIATGFWSGAIERGAYGLAGSVGLIGAVAVNPFLGMAAYSTTEFERIKLENPEMNTQAAGLLSTLEGGLNAAIDQFQISALMGKGMLLGGLLAGMKGGGVFNYAKRVALIQGEQFLQENLQDLIAPVTESIASALRTDMPDKDFMGQLSEYWQTRPEVFFAVLPLALLGGGFVSSSDFRNLQKTMTPERLRGFGFSEETIAHITSSENPAQFDERFREATASRSTEDIKRGIALMTGNLENLRATDLDHVLSEERNADGTSTWVLHDFEGKEVGRFSDYNAATEVLRQNVAANLTNEKTTLRDLATWAYKVLKDPTILLDQKPVSVAQELERMKGIGDEAGIVRLMDRLKLANLQDKDFNTLHILGETTIEQVRDGVYRAVIKLHENSSPRDALEEINHGFFKTAMASGKYTIGQYQTWLEQTERATGKVLPRGTEMEVIESLAQVTEDYLTGRIDDTSMPVSFVDYIKKIALVFKEALVRYLKMDEAFKAGSIDTDFKTALEESLGIDPQLRMDRQRTEAAEKLDPSLSVRDTGPDETPGEDAGTEAGTPTEDVPVEQIDPSKQTEEEGWREIPWREDLQYSVRSLPTAFPDMDKAIFDQILAASKEGKIRSVYIDRMKVGSYLGVDLQGGMFYPTILENLQAGVVWAFNARNAANQVYQRAQDGGGYVMLVLMQEGNVIGNKTFTHVWFKALKKNISSGKITLDAALARLNEARQKYSELTGNTEEWKTLAQAQKDFLALPQRVRGNSYFKKSKSALASGVEKINYQELLTQQMTRTGFPDAATLVSKVEEPSFKGLPIQTIVGIIKIDQVPAGQDPVMTAAQAGVPEHLSYQFVLKGTPVAKMTKFGQLSALNPAIADEILSQDKEKWDIRQAIAYSVRETKLDADQIAAIVKKMSAQQVRDALSRAKLTTTPRMVAMLGEFPEYLSPVIEYMLEKRQSLLDGNVSPRDVAKAYWMTIASIGADAIDVSTIAEKAQAKGIPFNPDPMFMTTGADGQPQMRPEELAAYWLGTPEGQRALDNVQEGNFDPADFESGLVLRDSYGRNDLRERWRVTGKGKPNSKHTIMVDGEAVKVEVTDKGNWSHTLDEQDTPVQLPEGLTENKRVQTSGAVGETKAKAVNLTNLVEFTRRINEAKGDPTKLEEAVTSAAGIAEGKKGFISHFLGFGEWSTIDAVELNIWLAGVGDTSQATQAQKMIAAIAKKASGGTATRADIFSRIRKAIIGLRKKAKGADTIPMEVAPHILHHWIWDAAKGIQTTHEGLYHAMKNYSIREASDPDLARYDGWKSVEVSKQGRAFSPIVRDLLQRRANGENISRETLDRAINQNFPSQLAFVPASATDLPTQDEVNNAVGKKGDNAVKKTDIVAGQPVTIRQDVPSWTNHGVGVVTIDTERGKSYAASAAIDNPQFVIDRKTEALSLRIGMGGDKKPHIQIKGTWSEDQSMPTDLEQRTQVGYNPDRHSYYYNRSTGQQITGASKAYQIGNVVFVTDPQYGDGKISDLSYSIREQGEIDRVASAVNAMNRGPEGRLAVYERAKERFMRLLLENKDALDAIKQDEAADPSAAIAMLDQDALDQSANLEVEMVNEIDAALSDNAKAYQDRRDNAPEEDQKQITRDERDRAKLLEKGIRDKFAEQRKRVADKATAAKEKLKREAETKRSKGKAEYASRVRSEKLMQAVIELDALLSVLPVEVMGKVGGFTTLAKIGTGEKALGKFFAKRVEMVDKQLERYLNAAYDEQLTKIFERAKPKNNQPGEKPKGIGPEIMRLFAVLKEAREWNAQRVASHIAALEYEIANNDLSPEDEAYKRQEAALVALVGNWKPTSRGYTDPSTGNTTYVRIDDGADSNRRYAAVTALRETWANGYRQFLGKQIAFKQAKLIGQDEAIVSTGKTGDLSGRQDRALKDNGLGGKFRRWLYNLTSFDQFLGLNFGDNNFVTNRWSDRQRLADNAKEDSIQAKAQGLEDLFIRLAGSRLDGEKLRFQMSQKSMLISRVGHRPLRFSELEGLTATMMWMQADGRRHMSGQYDDNGMLTSAWSYDQDFIDQIEGSLSDEALEVRQYLLDNYESEYDRINKVYRELNGIDLPKILFYSPLIVAPHQAPAGMVADPVTNMAVSASSIAPGAIRTRSAMAVAEPLFRDALATYVAHFKQMEHYIAYAPMMREMNGVLRSRNVQNAIAEKNGEQAVKVLNLWLDMFNQGGNRDAGSQLALSEDISNWLGRASQVALVGRIGTLLIQSTQLAAGLAEMPHGAYVVRMSKLLTGNLGWGKSLDSAYIQRRMNEMPPIVREMLAGLRSMEPTALKHNVAKIGRLISGADALFTAGTFAIVYDYHYTQALRMGYGEVEADAYAANTAERATDRLAQPTRMGSKSIYELTRSSEFARISWAFASDARKTLALAAYAVANKSAGEAGRTVGSFMILATLAAALIRNAWRDARDDDDDEWFDERNWNGKRLLLALTTEPLQGIPFVGDLATEGMYAATSEYHQQGTLLSPVRAIRAVKHLPDSLTGNREVEDMLKDLNGILGTMGLFNQDIAAAASLSTIASDAFGLGKNAKKAIEE